MYLLKQTLLFCFLTLAAGRAGAVIAHPALAGGAHAAGTAQITANGHTAVLNAFATKKTFRQRLSDRVRRFYGGNRIGGLLILGFVFLLAGAIILTAGLTSGNSGALGYGAVFAGIGLLIILVLAGNRRGGGGGGVYRRRF